MTRGAVWISRGRQVDRLRRASARAKPEQVLHLYYDPRILAAEPPPAELVADEGSFSVWFKPAGMLSQGSKWGDHCTLGRWAERHLRPERPAFTVHRLDRATSGLMLLAHGKGVAADLSRAFRERSVEKRYEAIVRGLLAANELPIEEALDEKAARSVVRALERDEQAERTRVSVRIETGRKHQIRRHLAGRGHPVVGDRLYGNDDSQDLQLVAVELAFVDPEGVQRRYELPEGLRPRL